MIKNLTTILLLGGKGTRLRSVINDRPKVMAPINGKPFLEILLDLLIKFEVRDIVLSTGYKSEYIETYLGEKYKDLNLNYSKEESPRGTAGGVLLAMQKFIDEEYLVMNGDNFVEFDLLSFYNFHKNNCNDITMLVKKVDDMARFGSVSFDENKKVQGFKEKDSNAGSGYINCGIYLFNSSVVNSIPENIPSSLERDFFPHMLQKNFYVVETDGRHLDIGTPESYEIAQHFFV